MKIKYWSELTDIRLNRVRVNEVKLYSLNGMVVVKLLIFLLGFGNVGSSV